MTFGVDVIEALGSSVVSLRVRGLQRQVTGLHLWDQATTPAAGALIGGAGASDEEAQLQAVELATACGAAAVALPEPLCPAAEERARARGLTLVTLNSEIEWSTFTWLVRTLLLHADPTTSRVASAQHNLFDFAEQIASLVDSSVTIEDSANRVVAYSATTQHTDAARQSTIMGRAVPPDVLRQLRTTGALRKLKQKSPFLVTAHAPGFTQRLVVPLHFGDQLVGSIWVIWDRRRDPSLEHELAQAATTVALQLVQLRAEMRVIDQHTAERVRAVLTGRPDVAGPQLFTTTGKVRVVALERFSAADPNSDVTLWRGYLRRKSWADPALTELAGSVFAVVDERPGPGGWTWLQQHVDTTGPGAAGASRVTCMYPTLALACTEASDALDVALATGRKSAAHEHVWDAIVLRHANEAAGSVAQTQLQLLLDVDRVEGSDLAATLCVWLEQWGDVKAAADRLHVHPNTVRLRMKKVHQLVGSLLTTPSQRTAALLLLLSVSHEVQPVRLRPPN